MAANAHCANSFETGRSNSLAFENRWQWPVSYRSIEVLAVIIDILIILSAGVLADTIYRLATTGFASEITDYTAAAAVVAALFTSLLKGRGLYKPMGLLTWTSQVRAVTLTWIGVFMFLAGCVFALKIGSTFSRGTIVSFAAIGLFGLVAHRTFWRRALEIGLASGQWSGRTIFASLRRSATALAAWLPDTTSFCTGCRQFACLALGRYHIAGHLLHALLECRRGIYCGRAAKLDQDSKIGGAPPFAAVARQPGCARTSVKVAHAAGERNWQRDRY